MKIKGTVVYNEIETGFWGVEGNDGKKYRPINMPEQLKTVGAKVSLLVEPVDMMSFIMWGETVKVVGFETIGTL